MKKMYKAVFLVIPLLFIGRLGFAAQELLNDDEKLSVQVSNTFEKTSPGDKAEKPVETSQEKPLKPPEHVQEITPPKNVQEEKPSKKEEKSIPPDQVVAGHVKSGALYGAAGGAVVAALIVPSLNGVALALGVGLGLVGLGAALGLLIGWVIGISLVAKQILNP